MGDKIKAVQLTQLGLENSKRFDPFIYTDILAEYTSQTKTPIFHFWTMKNQAILGMQDTRLPHLEDALKVIHQYDYFPVVRNSGGLAVVSDAGILNFSIIMPQPTDKDKTINEGYEDMKRIISSLFESFCVTVDSYEVVDSYCPGEYDLSIKGKKIAGIAQRRIKKGLAIMIYLSISGDQHARGQMIQDFYKKGLKDKFAQEGFPPVNPDSMANINDLLQTDFSVSDIKKDILTILSQTFDFDKNSQQAFDDFLLSEDFQISYNKQSQRMTQRNEKIIF